MSDLNVDMIHFAMLNGEDVSSLIRSIVTDNPNIKGIELVECGAEFPKIVIDYVKSDSVIQFADFTGRHYCN